MSSILPSDRPLSCPPFDRVWRATARGYYGPSSPAAAETQGLIDSDARRSQDKAFELRAGPGIHQALALPGTGCFLPPSGVPRPTMLPPAFAGTLVADLGPIVFWLLINNKVIGLVSGALACVLIWKTDGRFQGQRAWRPARLCTWSFAQSYFSGTMSAGTSRSIIRPARPSCAERTPTQAS